MDFSLEEEHEAIREVAQQVISDFSTHERLRGIERSEGNRHDPELWQKLSEVGILGAVIPESHGGAGLDVVALGQILETAGQYAAAIPIWETLGLGVLPVAEFATEEMQNRLLPAVNDGELILTAGWHEAGNNPLTPVTMAERTSNGWSLNGTKICVPSAMIADGILVPAAVEAGSVGLFYVDFNAVGVAREPITTTFGDPQGTVSFVDAEAELVGEGYATLQWAYDHAVATQCAVAIGVLAESLRLTSEYTKERHQFDSPIASFQAVAHRAADAFIDTEAVRLTTQQALWRLRENMDASNEVAVAKYWAAFGGQRVVHTGQHLHGGVGVDRDYPLHRYFLQAKQIELQLGGATEQLLALGKRIAAS